jgi:hypothetical protein
MAGGPLTSLSGLAGLALMQKTMSIDTRGDVKRLEAAGFDRAQGEALAEALRDELVLELATKVDLDRLGNRMETALWKHTVAILVAVIAVGGFLIRFPQ